MRARWIPAFAGMRYIRGGGNDDEAKEE